MRYASIDIGTNTILMLIAEISTDPIHGDGAPEINRIADFYEVPRIGENVSAAKELSRDAMERGFEVLKKYRSIAREYSVDKIAASATSAVRDASNREDFVKLVEDKFGFEVEVISGETEARLGYLAALSGAPNRTESTLVIDIGGGSTELSYGIGMRPQKCNSLDIGAVRVMEKCFIHNPPSDDELKKAAGLVEKAMKLYPFHEVLVNGDSPRQIFAVPGTATTLALIAQGKYNFNLEAVTNYEMSYDALKHIFETIRWKTPAEIREMTEAAKGRADVLLAGALILMKVLEATRAERFLTTDRGLRYGYLVHKFMQLSKENRF